MSKWSPTACSLHLEPLSSLFIPVDNIHGRTAKAALQQMDQQLQAGGVDLLPGGEVSRLTRRGIRDKNGTPAVSWQNTVPRCRRGLTPATAPCLRQYAGLRQPAAAPADAADVSPAQQQPAGAYRPADPGRTGSMRSPALASLPAAAISTLNSCAKGCRGGLKPKAPSPVRKTGRCSNANCTRPNAGRTADGKVIYLWQRNGRRTRRCCASWDVAEIAFRAVGEGSGKGGISTGMTTTICI